VNVRIAFAAALLAAGAMVGCGSPTPTQTKETPMGDTSVAEQDKIKEALVKAGIKNPPAAVLENDKDTWVVVITPDGVGPNGEPPPGRPIPLRVLVNKHTFEVTKQGDPNQKKGPREM
jgi:hypothetical protein